jgi:MoxR-like ATPase
MRASATASATAPAAAHTKKKFECWPIASAVLAHSQRVLLHGPPGTGKTYAATRLGLQNGQLVASCTLTPDTPAAELRGFYVPRGNEFAWQDGPAATAWRTGGRLVLNEIDRATGDLLSLLLAVCDDPLFAQLTLPSNETIRPAAGFTVVATMNAAPDDLDFALLDRFPVRIHVDEVAPGALQSLPADLRDIAAKSGVLADASRRISFRTWSEFAKLRASIGAESAARAVFGNRTDDIINAFLIAKG